jgi:DNA replication protein DnaC
MLQTNLVRAIRDLADATLDGTRKEHMEFLVTVPLLIIDDLGMRKLPLTAAEELLEIIMRRYERGQHDTDFEPSGRRLGQTAQRRGRGQRYA